MSCYFYFVYCLLERSCGDCDVISLYFMCCSVNGSVCLVCYVYVNCLLNNLQYVWCRCSVG